MPIQRTSKHFKLRPDAEEDLEIVSEATYNCLVRLTEPGLLYDELELMHLAKPEMDIWLGKRGYYRMNKAGGQATHIRDILRNLWTNGLIDKFATGTFVMSGRNTGVVWRINDRRRSAGVRRLQEAFRWQ